MTADLTVIIAFTLSFLNTGAIGSTFFVSNETAKIIKICLIILDTVTILALIPLIS